MMRQAVNAFNVLILYIHAYPKHGHVVFQPVFSDAQIRSLYFIGLIPRASCTDIT